VILDGENCWEYYPYNGYYFLDALYRSLETHAGIRPTTYRKLLEGRTEGYPPGRRPIVAGTLDRLVAGSWVGGSFSTWIGSPEKNRAWELLIAAKQAFDLVAGSARLTAEQLRLATRQLAVCEASDWFWWLSDANPASSVAEFDGLYRAHLARLYELIDLPPPTTLAQPICHGRGHPEIGGAMRRANAP
jgi:alpha-amylase/alpha-mannosidase (GH57 family)